MIWVRACRSHSLAKHYQLQPRWFARNTSNGGQTPPDQGEVSVKITQTAQPNRSRKHREPTSVIFSGIQPTGVPHLGNYLGALRQWKQLQDEKIQGGSSKNHRLFFSIVDLHALTHTQDPASLLGRKYETLASLLAIGLDPKHSTIFFQSMVCSL